MDRYISWPGRALAYKIGQLRFLELRALPLDILEQEVRRWISAAKVEKGAAGAR